MRTKRSWIALVLAGLVLTVGCEYNSVDKVEPKAEPKEFLTGWEITKRAADFSFGPRAMFFLNSEIGYVVGDNGNITKTIDAGETWEKQRSGATLRLNSVCFVNDTIGYVAGQAMSSCLDDDCGKGGLILKTTDGGETWTKNFFATLPSFNNLHFFDELNGLSIIRMADEANSHHLAKTVDGGKSWNFIDLAIWESDIFYTIENVVFVIGWNARVYKSEDQGTTWKTIATPEQPSSIYFIDKNVGFFQGGTRFYKTTDGGINWNRIGLPFASFGLLHFYNETEGFNVTQVLEYRGGDFPVFKGCISYQTFNGGEDWTKSDLTTEYVPGYFFFPQSDLGYSANSINFYTIKRK